MKEAFLRIFEEYPQWALILSLFISIVIAVAGVVPSFFITAANILFFGFWKGTLISFAGEAIGALVAFYLYRKGFRAKAAPRLGKFPKVQGLVEAEGNQAFLLVMSLRLLPFVPSGLVTFAAAVGRISLLNFLFASSVGKAPALLMEAFAVEQVIRVTWAGKIILGIIAISLFIMALKPRK